LYGLGESGDTRFGMTSLDLSLSDDVNTQQAYGAGSSNDLAIPGQVSVAPGPNNCQVCGTPLADEFDKVIGLCDVHQRDRRHESDGLALDTGQGAGRGQWHARSPDGMISGPMDLEDLRGRIREGSFSATDEFSRDGVDFGPIARFKELAYLASLTGDFGTSPRYAGATFQPGLSRFVTPVLVLLILAGVGYLAYSQQDQLIRLVDGLTSSGDTAAPRGPNPLNRYRTAWALAHPDVSGTAAEHLVTAQARHLEDTWRAYRQAEDAFQRALLLDDEDAAAIAGYVENLVVWRYETASPEEIRAAEQAARYAIALEPQSGAAHRALGALAYKRLDLNGCRAGADAALQRDATDGRAKLLLAQCYLEGNVALAIKESERAQQLLPELRRADQIRGLAYAKQGRFASAFQVLSERLKVDPKNAAVHRLYGWVAQEVGETKEAWSHYEQALRLGEDTQATLLAMAELALETDRAADAVGYYRRIIDTTKLYGDRGARVYTGWARAELSRRRGQRAVELADQALRFAPRSPSALLVRGEAALFTKSATTASLYAKQAESTRAGEPSILVLAGRALAAQDRRPEGIKKLQEALTNDPQDPRLKGVLAGEYLKQKGVAQAFALMRRAADVDPQSVDARSRIGLLGLNKLSVLDAITQFRRAAIDERNASVAYSSIGLLFYHLGDRARAKGAIDRAIRLDDANMTALIYQSQLALDRGDRRRARSAAQKLLAVERGSALGYLLLARSMAADGKADKARPLYRSALRSDPGLLPAKVELAGLDLETPERPSAVKALQDANLINPSSLTIRRLLLKAGL
ncbi:MAG: tetratricopeptide repeat protein, partial [Myxococcota bacterium]